MIPFIVRRPFHDLTNGNYFPKGCWVTIYESWQDENFSVFHSADIYGLKTIIPAWNVSEVYKPN